MSRQARKNTSSRWSQSSRRSNGTQRRGGSMSVTGREPPRGLSALSPGVETAMWSEPSRHPRTCEATYALARGAVVGHYRRPRATDVDRTPHGWLAQGHTFSPALGGRSLKAWLAYRTLPAGFGPHPFRDGPVARGFAAARKRVGHIGCLPRERRRVAIPGT